MEHERGYDPKNIHTMEVQAMIAQRISVKYRPELKYWKQPQQSQAQKIKAMKPADILDKVMDLHLQYTREPKREVLQQFNWWADVYNFMRGQHIIEQKTPQPRERQRSRPAMDHRERIRHRDNMWVV